jgi:hypothetical protein
MRGAGGIEQGDDPVVLRIQGADRVSGIPASYIRERESLREALKATLRLPGVDRYRG